MNIGVGSLFKICVGINLGIGKGFRSNLKNNIALKACATMFLREAIDVATDNKTNLPAVQNGHVFAARTTLEGAAEKHVNVT